MIKAVFSELKALLSSPWRIAAYLLLLLVPLGYGGLFLSGFWSPVRNINRLNIKIVNLDTKNDISNTMAKDLAKDEIHIKAGAVNYKMHLSYTDIYKNEGQLESAVNNSKIDAAFTIPENYQANMKKALVDNIPKLFINLLKDPNFQTAFFKWIMNPGTIPPELLTGFVLNIPDLELPKLGFYNSYKNNFLTGELTNLVANTNAMRNALINSVLKDVSYYGSGPGTINKEIADALYKLWPKNVIRPVKANFEKIIGTFLKTFGTKINKDYTAFQKAASSFIDHQNIGGNINTYGKGESPYFFSIAIWAGMLVGGFFFQNRRTKAQEKNSTFVNYFSKSLIWIGTSWIQSTLLWLFSVLFWGQKSGYDAKLFFSFYGYMLFVGILFALIVQAILFSLRRSEVGSLIVVILLVTQLVSSSGTFPSEMQNGIFNFFNKLVPFTYTILSFRDMLYSPNFTSFLLYQLPILPFLLLVPISFTLNYFYDKKTFLKLGKYNSYGLPKE